MNSFLKGIARLLDVGGLLSDNDAAFTSDEDAIRSDWQTVGRDMWWSVDKFRRITEAERDALYTRYTRLHNVNLDAPRPDSDCD